MPAKRTDFTDEQLIELYDSGLSSLQIAELLNTVDSTVRRRLHSAGHKLRGAHDKIIRLDVRENTEEICRLYFDEKISPVDIGKMFNCSVVTIRRAIKKTGASLNQPNYYAELDDEAYLYDCYINQRLSYRKIAEIIGCGKTVVEKRVKKFRFETRKSPSDFTPEERKTMYGKSKEDHHLWRGGVTPLYNLVRNRVAWVSRNRMRLDGFKCQSCGQRNGDHHVHHIRRFSDILNEIISENPHFNLQSVDDLFSLTDICAEDYRLLDINNLITLCELCHADKHQDLPIGFIINNKFKPS